MQNMSTAYFYILIGYRISVKGGSCYQSKTFTVLCIDMNLRTIVYAFGKIFDVLKVSFSIAIENQALYRELKTCSLYIPLHSWQFEDRTKYRTTCCSQNQEWRISIPPRRAVFRTLRQACRFWWEKQRQPWKVPKTQ